MVEDKGDKNKGRIEPTRLGRIVGSGRDLGKGNKPWIDEETMSFLRMRARQEGLNPDSNNATLHRLDPLDTRLFQPKEPGRLQIRFGDNSVYDVPTDAVIPIENIKFIIPEKRIVEGVEAIAGGTRRERESAQRNLIRQVKEGNIGDLLDVFTTTLVAMEGIRRPDRWLGFFTSIGISVPGTVAALSNLRSFMLELTRTLSGESRTYSVNTDSIVIKTKIAGCDSAFQLFRQIFTQDRDKMPIGFHTLFSCIHGIQTSPEPKGIGVFAAAEFSEKEMRQLISFRTKEGLNLTQQDVDLIFKAAGSLMEAHQSPVRSLLTNLYQLSGENIDLMVGSLKSRDPAVRNNTRRFLQEPGADDTDAGLRDKLEFYYQIQQLLLKIMDRDPEVDEDLAGSIDGFVTAMSLDEGHLAYSHGLVALLIMDYSRVIPSLGESSPLGKPTLVDGDFAEKLVNSTIDRPSINLLRILYGETGKPSLDQQSFIELFDDRRALGFFVDNLRTNWQDLRRISREIIWPSLVAERGAKSWPGEDELPILEFTGTHPAAVLGFKELLFFIRGYQRPEVGLAFRLRETEDVLRARINTDGSLTSHMDIEESHPHIHAFMEYLAVSSFNSLVTAASNRTVVRSEDGVNFRVAEKQEPESKNGYAVSLPRHETSYITLKPRRRMTTDEILEEERVREKIPVPIPQKVVPLAYARRYAYFKSKIEEERSKGKNASEDEIKKYEAEMILNFSRIANPSGLKLDNLPREFQLMQTGNKYMETWRKAHHRPKLSSEEESDVVALFVRRYKAAPSMLTKELETWFTQPPKG